MTGKELIDDTLRKLDEDPDNPYYFSRADVLNALNEGLALWCLLTLELEDILTFVVPGGQRSIEAGAQDGRWIVPLAILAEQVPLKPTDFGQLHARSASWPAHTGEPTHYAIAGCEMVVFYPKPDQPVTVQAHYARAAAVLTEGNSPEIAEAQHCVLMDYAIPRLRLNDGAGFLQKDLPKLQDFIAAAQVKAQQVAAKHQALGYDRLPPEIRMPDFSKIIQEMKRGTRVERNAGR